MSQVEKSAVKSLLSMHRNYAELDEYLEAQLKEAGYAGVDVQRNPVGTRITVFVTRPGLAIGRRGAGIKELTERVAQKFNLPNPQIAVSEVERPELNPRIMAQRTAQIVARGTAFRRAANWTMTTIMEAGAMGCEIGVAGSATHIAGRVLGNKNRRRRRGVGDAHSKPTGGDESLHKVIHSRRRPSACWKRSTSKSEIQTRQVAFCQPRNCRNHACVLGHVV